MERRERWRFWAPRAGLALCLAAGLVFAYTQQPWTKDPLSQARADAAAALQAVDDGDLAAVDELLAANRGQADFAYYFTSKVTPRALGDALATVAGTSKSTPIKADVDTKAYELALTDLAGTLALATYGTGDRALPRSWTDDFISATTTPETLYGEDGDGSGSPAQERVDQDAANKQNLLLLLSRGYWSTGFLNAVTAAYWEFDRDEGDDAWPGATLKDAEYAPAPNGSYLTDGILALAAALTANPAASVWAFRDFQPGTEKVEGSDYVIGKFTHFLLFEHRYPESPDDGGIGTTAALTALSSAIDATGGPAGTEIAASVLAAASDGPARDALILRALAHDLTDESGCSWNPTDYWTCTTDVADAVRHWTQRWGHQVLGVLSSATRLPWPASGVGYAAIIVNATWYAVEGDYANAGLSLASVYPELSFLKIAKLLKLGAAAEKAAAAADEVAQAAMAIRAGANDAMALELAVAVASRIQ